MLDARLPGHRSIRAVAFDLDGTLADSAPGICSTFSTVLSEAGHPLPPMAEIAAMIGLPLGDIMVRYAPGATADDLEVLVTRYRSIYSSSVVPATLLFPRAWSLLRACRAAGLELAIVTGKTTEVADSMLRRCRIRGLFRTVVGNERAVRPKPFPDLMWIALDELGVPASETLLVGDGSHDVEMGRGAGVRTCGVAWGVHEVERLVAAGADHVVHSMAELRELILGPPVSSPAVYSG
ncbi:MAG TPA: HAD family hydrolase [Chloroflexota bacterium]|nr:HAD family hydrolase [Chloroflexota bacterium]